MNDDPHGYDGLAKLDALIAEQDARDEKRERERAERTDVLMRRIYHGRTEREMARLAPARDSVAAQIKLLADRLRTYLGDDYGITGDSVRAGFVVDLANGLQMVAIEIGGRVFTHGSGESVIVLREDDGDLQFAELGPDGEAIEPWRSAPEDWQMGLLG